MFGFAGAIAPQILPITSIIPVIAFIAAAVYLADVRPAVRQYGSGGSSSSGPYGGW